MDISEGKIPGVLVMKMNKFIDERGFFSRNFCSGTLKSHGAYSDVNQANISFNKFKGTIRGFHFQVGGQEEAKTVTVLSGSLHYKIIDLRLGSPTYLQHESFDLSALDLVIQVPKGCAPAFQTLEDNVLLHYYVSNPYSKELERGIRYNDNYFNFEWPLKPSVVSNRDLTFNDFDIEEIKKEGLIFSKSQ